MFKKMSLLCMLFSLATFVLLFAACGKTEPAETTAPVIAAEDDTASETDAPEETTAEPETVARPTADGQAVEAYDISFYLPESLTANEWNGMLGVYDFYTGENTTGTPTGMDITLSATAESNADGDLESYARATSAQKYGLTADLATETINGADWLILQADGQKDYYAIFNSGLYEIHTLRGGETQEAYDAAVAMLEETLFLSVNPN